jgi:hypothetical protein
MFSARFVTVFALAAGVGFVAANCGSDGGSSSTGGLNCPPTGQSNCTAEQTKPYTDCIFSKCDSQYQACFGAGYKSGSFGGTCQAYIACFSKCGCGDNACRAACPAPTGECQTCLTQLGTCTIGAGCTPPTCGGGGAGGGGGGGGGGAGGGGGGGSGTCADLMKCCASATNASIKQACEAQYNALKGQAGSDMACGLIAGQYKAGGLCTF